MQYAYLSGTGTTTVLSSGGYTLRRIVAGTAPTGSYAAIVSVYDSATAGSGQVANLEFGANAGGMPPGSYEIGATLANGLTVEISNEGTSLTIVYE